MSRLSNDVDGVENVVTDTVFGLARNLLIAVATLALMVRYSWQLTLFTLVLIPLIGWPVRRAGQATYRARGRTQTQLAAMFAYLQEILGVSVHSAAIARARATAGAHHPGARQAENALM